MNFAQEIFILCSIGVIAIAAVILNQKYITSDAKISVDAGYNLTRNEHIFVLSVYISRILFLGIALAVMFAGISNLFSMFWTWLGTL